MNLMIQVNPLYLIIKLLIIVQFLVDTNYYLLYVIVSSFIYLFMLKIRGSHLEFLILFL